LRHGHRRARVRGRARTDRGCPSRLGAAAAGVRARCAEALVDRKVFNGGEPSPEAEFIAIFATIEEHHGAYSHAPALSEIEVLGAQPTFEVRAELSEYGFDDVSPSQRGFAARRDV